MMKLLMLLLACSVAPAQDTTVKITGAGPRSSTSSVNVQYKSALVTFALGSGTIDGAGLVSLPITINSKTGQLPAAVQFDLAWTPADVAQVSFSIGAAASAAQKTIQCAPQATGQRCIVSGLNANGITDGVIAFANIQTNLTSQSVTTVTMFGEVAASIGASKLNSIVAPGGGVISMPALLATVTCAQPDIWQTLVVSCTVSLNKPAPTGGVLIALASDSALVSAPASVSIAAGATAGTFSLTGM